jgi:hypothetical protein
MFLSQGFLGDLIFSFRAPCPTHARQSLARGAPIGEDCPRAGVGYERESVRRTRRARLLTSQSRGVRPRRTRNPIVTSTAAFNVATRGNENNFFGCPHHKHEVLATVVGLPHAEQTFTCLMECSFLEGSQLNA